MKKIVLYFLLIVNIEAFSKFDWQKLPTIDDLNSNKRLSIVFASQNLENPASMFGHTFLVVHNDMPPEPDAITIEFLGITNDDFSSYINALITHIDGEFRLSKFFIKNREYEFEGRNLWVYEINLTKNEKQKVFNSISSTIKNKTFPYKFINQNCSFYILNAVIKNNFEARPIYTLPKLTIRDLKERGYINASPILVESDQSKVITFLNSLNTIDKNKIAQMIEDNSFPITELSWEVRKGLDLALTYKIPREPSIEKRKLYFNIKKKLIEIEKDDQSRRNQYLTHSDPIETYGDTHLRFGYGVESQTIIFEGKLTQRDFYTSKNDGLSNSYLEIMKGKMSVTKEIKTRVQQFTFLKLESIIPNENFNEPFNSLIDISIYNHFFEKDKSAKESVLRYGSGLSIKLKDLTLGAIPYLGLRYFNISSSNGFEPDLGILMKLNYWMNDTISIEGSLINYFHTKLPFKYKANIKFATRLNSRWTIGVEGEIYDKNKEGELSLIYGF